MTRALPTMAAPPRRREIDHRTIKLLVGLAAMTLAPLTNFFAKQQHLQSISESYWEGGWSQTIFIGFLFAICSLMLAYNGFSITEMILSKVAAIAGLGVALFPCQCNTHDEVIPHMHGILAGIMFLILAWFCYTFLSRAKAKPYPQKSIRMTIYVACGVAILVAVLALAIDNLPGAPVSSVFPRATFYGEYLGLVSFGLSWLTASKVLPFITNERERFLPGRRHNPE